MKHVKELLHSAIITLANINLFTFYDYPTQCLLFILFYELHIICNMKTKKDILLVIISYKNSCVRCIHAYDCLVFSNNNNSGIYVSSLSFIHEHHFLVSTFYFFNFKGNANFFPLKCYNRVEGNEIIKIAKGMFPSCLLYYYFWSKKSHARRI